ncbi:MAG: hypothetical protein HN380_30145, partial [Victivallales bacterium]|nr:hypothetical protein [Victivallales bacterium]
MRQKTGVSTGFLVFCATMVLTVGRPAAQEPQGPGNGAKPVLSLTIRCDETEWKVGDEVAVTFVIKNEGKSLYEYSDRNYDRSGRMGEYKLSATDANGKAMPDPRAKRRVSRGGGLAGIGELVPGKSFAKTIALNRWALLTQAGTYRVVGTYHCEGKWPAITSQPIEITLGPRTEQEMGAHVERLCARLATVRDPLRAALVRKLMYTCDRRAIPALLDAMQRADAASYWAGEAFNHYLPKTPEVDRALLAAAATRGLARGMFQVLKQRGVTREQITPVIDVSLSPDHPAAWGEGVLAAQQYADDRFTPRLIAIATDLKSPARRAAIFALAVNRTDESVATLKELLQEPDPPKPIRQTIRQTTEFAIRTAYLYRGNAEGRRLRKDDFDAKY